MFRNGWQAWAGICTGWIQHEIGKVVGMSRGRITQIVNNTNFGEINNLHSHGHDMEYRARHYNMDLPLAWALRLEGKTDQERFKEVEWVTPIRYCLPVVDVPGFWILWLRLRRLRCFFITSYFFSHAGSLIPSRYSLIL